MTTSGPVTLTWHGNDLYAGTIRIARVVKNLKPFFWRGLFDHIATGPEPTEELARSATIEAALRALDGK